MKQKTKRSQSFARSSVSGAAAWGLLSVLLPIASVAQVYVSPQGSDAGDGSKMHPVQSLDHARELARSGGSRQILLGDGVYRLTTPLTLSPVDSGESFAGMPGAQPVVGGGVAVTGWKLVDAKRNLWRAPVPAGLVNSRQMYVDGRRAQRAQGRVPV